MGDFKEKEVILQKLQLTKKFSPYIFSKFAPQ